MAINSKQKGSRVELMIVNWLKERGCEARRTAQFNGKGEDALADIVGEGPLAIWHLECKGTATGKIPVGTYKKWIKQVTDDKRPEEIPVILHKANDRQLVAILKIEDWNSITRDQVIYPYPAAKPGLDVPNLLVEMCVHLDIERVVNKQNFRPIPTVLLPLELTNINESTMLAVVNAEDWLIAAKELHAKN